MSICFKLGVITVVGICSVVGVCGCTSQKQHIVQLPKTIDYDAIPNVTCAETLLSDCIIEEEYINALAQKCSVVISGGEKITYCRDSSGKVQALKKITQ